MEVVVVAAGCTAAAAAAAAASAAQLAHLYDIVAVFGRSANVCAAVQRKPNQWGWRARRSQCEAL